MESAIKPLPDIPDALRLAASTGKLIPFIGAGVSQLGGCPDWDQFATAALRTFVEQGKLDHAQFAQLAQLNARTRLSVAVGLERKHKVDIDFGEILGAVHDTSKNALGLQVYGQLGRLAKTFITTNYDEWLDVAVAGSPSRATESDVSTSTAPTLTRTPYYRPDMFNTSLLSTPDVVIHIHGSIRDRSSMVLTTGDYLQRYSNHVVSQSGVEENQYLNFLTQSFKTRNILFIGYSLGELEVLEYVIQKALRKQIGGRSVRQEPQHFLLQGFFSHEQTIMESLAEYYLNEFNVALIPYSRDVKNWVQLIDVISYLAGEIPVKPTLSSTKWMEMQELLS